MSLAELRDGDVATEWIVREEITLGPNQYDLYNKSLRTNYLRLLRGSGIELLGVYRPQLLTVAATAFWSLRNGLVDLAGLEEIQGTREHTHWGNLALSSRSAWSATVFQAVGDGGVGR
jgi:hypothetical protein